jgi:hypothetical protein
MKDRFKLRNGVEILSLARRRAQVNFSARFGPSYSVREPSAEVIAAMRASLQAGGDVPGAGAAPTSFDQINPKDSDYIYPLFRALSATLLDGIWVDFSKEGVLKAAVPLYLGQTVYTDHGRPKMFYGREFSVSDWVGAISQAFWDEKGEQSGGIPGVNVEMKIDWTMDVKLARGLLMKPPAIHSTSSTIEFSWDPSHQDLMDEQRFFDLLGEEVGGQIVRLVVTNVEKIYEQSLVWQGQDQIAKQLPDETETDDENLSADDREAIRLSRGQPPAPLRLAGKTKEKHTVQLTAEQKTALGITHEGEDVPDADVISKATQFAMRATSADTIVSAARAEVLRLARHAEGVGEGDKRALPEVIAALINGADPSQLPALTQMYQEKAAKVFPLTCAQGHPATLSRSSVEDAPVVGEGVQEEVRRSSLL